MRTVINRSEREPESTFIMSEQISFDFLKKIDFNSAVYFSAFMRCRTIYTTSVVMNCSPATVSIMIKRFCSYFSEPLLEMKGRALTPTIYAIELDGIIMEVISSFHFSLDDNINNKVSVQGWPSGHNLMHPTEDSAALKNGRVRYCCFCNVV